MANEQRTMARGREPGGAGLLVVAAAGWILAVTLVRSAAVPYVSSFAGSLALALASYVLLVAGMLALALAVEKAGLPSLGFTAARPARQVGWGAALALVLLALVAGLPLLLGAGPSEVLGPPASDAGTLAVVLAYHLFVVGFGEEIVFRGYLLSRLTRATGSAIAGVVGSSILFGLWHAAAGGDWMQAGITTVIGLVLGAARQWLPGCSLVSVALAHGLYDSALTLLATLT